MLSTFNPQQVTIQSLQPAAHVSFLQPTITVQQLGASQSSADLLQPALGFNAMNSNNVTIKVQ